VLRERLGEAVGQALGGAAPQRLLLALVESGLARDEAYALVQPRALQAWDEQRDFCQLVEADAEIAARVDLDSVFDPSIFTRHVDTVFDRLSALRKEVVHA
jgi:adenylosuccinate lyase